MHTPPARGAGISHSPSHDQTMARVRLALAQACRDASEYARALAPTTTDRDTHPGEMITTGRRLRLHALRVLELTVMVELSRGATWGQVAEALGLSETETRCRYQTTWQRWLNDTPPPWPAVQGVTTTTGHSCDAAELDAWYARTGGPDTPPNAVSAGL